MRILIGILNSFVILSSVFLICLILIQRGKGGGLAGAFGGTGGSSAFGTKAGDVFTRVTMITAGIWMVMLMVLVVLYNQRTDSAWRDVAPANASKEVTPTPGGGTGKVKATVTPGGAGTKEKAKAPSESSSGPSMPPTSLPPVFPDEKPAPAPTSPKAK